MAWEEESKNNSGGSKGKGGRELKSTEIQKYVEDLPD